MPASAPLLAEFIGAPGSGKTRVATEVASLLTASGIRTARRPELEAVVQARFLGRNKLSTSVRWLGYLPFHPGWAAVACSWLASRDGTRVAERVVRVTHRVRALSAIAESGIDIWIPDEWILHEIALSMAGARGNGRARGLALLDAALNRLPLRLLVVQCEADPVTAARRVSGRRSASDLDGQPMADLIPTLRELAEIATTLRERAALAGHATMVVRADESATDAARSVADALRRLAPRAHRHQAGVSATRPRIEGAV